MRVVDIALFVSDPPARRRFRDLFSSHSCQVVEHDDFKEPAYEWEESRLAVIQCSGGALDPGIELARRLRRQSSRARIVFFASGGSEDMAVEALRLRAEDYLKLPLDAERIMRIVETSNPHGGGSARDSFIIGETAEMQAVKRLVSTVATSNSSVLVMGETGTGKEMVAEQVHARSSRRLKPFVCVNCAAIPETLVESELFGYEKGAFTGAVGSRDGKLAQAHGGTIFFDEIGEMSLPAQAKILRAIESREICRVGGQRRMQLDIRLIAATNQDLEALMKEQRFRADLYFRLNVARIMLPPLRERKSDIPLLVQHLLPHFNRTFHCCVQAFHDRVLGEFMNYSWPGNIRELKNVMEVVFLHLPHDTAVVTHLPEQVTATLRRMESTPADERQQLLSVLFQTHWNVSEAARRMNWSRMTMYRRLARHQISVERAVTSSPKCDSV